MKYKCPLCPKEYQSARKLFRHTKKIHGKYIMIITTLYPDGELR